MQEDHPYTLGRLGLSVADVDRMVADNPSLRSVLVGHAAEHHLLNLINDDPLVQDLGKPRDHDRGDKGDRRVRYRGHDLRVESKSLQSASVRRTGDGRFTGKAQIDASDRRPVQLPDGSTIETTCLLAGELDVVAVSLYAFDHAWRFGFIPAAHLPNSTHRAYSAYQRQHLLATALTVTWPLQAPLRETLREALDDAIAAAQHGENAGEVIETQPRLF